MEGLSCSGTGHIAEPNNPEQVPVAALKNDAEQVQADHKGDSLEITLRDSQSMWEDWTQSVLENLPASGSSLNEDTYELDVYSQHMPFDFEVEYSDEIDHFSRPDPVLVTETNEASSVNVNQEGSSDSGIKTIEQDEPQAVWVKWRGLWQAGIRCARADWPLSTLRAKPTRDSKQYLVIFFPRTRTYSWADVLLVRPIYEFPDPIANKIDEAGLMMVTDVTLARRYIMQKLAVSMLTTLDHLQREALVETSRDVSILKEFAMEAFRPNDYSDLGRVLLKLQKMILESCIASAWLQQSSQSWRQRCQDAKRAECIEMLTEELADSILWDTVNSLSAQSEQGSEWRNWKHEVLKWFSAWHPMDHAVGSKQPSNDSPSTPTIQTSRKRAKLEIRRSDVAHASSSNQSVPSQNSLTLFTGYDTKTAQLQYPKNENSAENPGIWDDIIIEAGNSDVIRTEDVLSTPTAVARTLPEGSGNHSRQCVAFTEAKRRQCVRYANEGNVYCCVHLNSGFLGSSSRVKSTLPSVSPMCGGTTVLGTMCKHRAIIGSSFCKKHRTQDGKKVTSPLNIRRRKNEKIASLSEIKSPLIVSEEAKTSSQVNSLLGIVKGPVHESDEAVQCIGGDECCLEIPKRHSLYCEKHIPSWLKRARNGKSRIVSKEVFIELLKECDSKEKKLHLHRACELFYRLFKSILSLRNPVPKDVQFQRAISEASKDFGISEFMMKLVSHEKDRLKKLWGFGDTQNLQDSTFEGAGPSQVQIASNDFDENTIKCKICTVEFLDDQALGNHWRESHRKEAHWLFMGYVCAICSDSFTNKKVLEAHVQERHHVQFVEQCMLLQCIPCGSSFGNPDQLWLHVFSSHPSSLKLLNSHEELIKASWQTDELNSLANAEQTKNDRRYICRFCGLKFDLLPDLGRHHQAAHMGQSQTPAGPSLTKKGVQLYSQKLKSGRLTRPVFRKGLNSASYKIRNRSVQNLKKRIQASNSAGPLEITPQPTVQDAGTLGRLTDSQCLSVANLLFSEIKKMKPCPTNSEILVVARSACCKVSLQVGLEGRYGILPEKMYLRAAKLCSEENIKVEWHRDDFVCPKGCKPILRRPALPQMELLSDYTFKATSPAPIMPSDWKMDESHCVLDSHHFTLDISENNITLCEDISFGLELVPIACVVDENLLKAEGNGGQLAELAFPWESFTYVTKPALDEAPVPHLKSSQLGCGCGYSTCSSGTCDHVYLFNNAYENAKDIYGKSMQGRFPYDECGRIILEEGYLVYECNQRCSCSRACQNRVLQNGVRVKLEMFKTENKGWAVRTREAILRGTFVCEYVGEVIDENEANERRVRYGKDGCKYFYEIDAQINDMGRLREEQVPYVIDTKNYGNISRYINHSCSPNLVNHQVVVESMDSQFAHIGLYANRDIASGEELTYNFQYKMLPGKGCSCLCGSSNCRGRLY